MGPLLRAVVPMAHGCGSVERLGQPGACECVHQLGGSSSYWLFAFRGMGSALALKDCTLITAVHMATFTQGQLQLVKYQQSTTIECAN